MNRLLTRILLLALIVVELTVGGLLAVERRKIVTPPVPDLSEVDPLTAAEYRKLAANCQTASDWAKLGEVYLATGFFPEAEVCFRQASTLEPKTADFAFKHAFALERVGRLSDANGQYLVAIDLQSSRTDDCWYYIGRNSLRMEQHESAGRAFARAPGFTGARYELAQLGMNDGQTAAAENVFEQLASEFPNAYPPVANRYRLALARNDKPAADVLADQFFRRATPLPTSFDTEVQWVFAAADGVGRAKVFRDAGREAQAGRFDVSESELRKALAARWEPEIADRLAEVVSIQGRPNEAAQILTEVIERGGPNADALWRLGQAYSTLGEPARALAAWERAARIATGPRTRDLWHDLASYYDRVKQPEKAKPLHARAHLYAGLDALASGRNAEAVKALELAVQTDPRFAQGWFALGEAHRFAGRTAQARDAYNQCLKVNPDHGRAMRSLRLLGG